MVRDPDENHQQKHIYDLVKDQVWIFLKMADGF